MIRLHTGQRALFIALGAAVLVLAAFGISRLALRGGGRTVQPQRSIAEAAIPPIDTVQPAEVETATFALGWFWSVDSQFGSIPGVVRTRVGYTGGTLENPTYHNLGDHTESVQVDFDPTQVSYADLLDVFWKAHSPTARAFGRQYMNAVFYHDEEQERLAKESRDRIAAETGKEVSTQILPASTFYLAEDYHQKYNLRRKDPFYGELAAVYPTTEELIASTAAARLNGYLGGYGTRAQLERELDSLGLSPEAGERLLRSVRR